MDIYTEITARIINEMEKGIIPWEKPWIARGGAISHATGKRYSLLNQMLFPDLSVQVLALFFSQTASGITVNFAHCLPLPVNKRLICFVSAFCLHFLQLFSGFSALVKCSRNHLFLLPAP